MKIFIALSLLLFPSFYSYAQKDSCKITTVTNTVTKVNRAEINFTIIGTETNNLYCTAFRSGKDFAVYFGLEVFNKTVCFTPGAKAKIIFTDHTQGQVINVQGDNCKGNFLVTGTIVNGLFSTNDSVLNQLTQKTIRAIRFQTNDGFLDYDVVDDNDRMSLNWANTFTRGIRCLKEWKEN
ncbi:MAG: hypothetical protein ABI415_08390 [Flavitalea sp.]